MTAMMDNMAPFLFALIAFGAALMVTVTGMAARHHEGEVEKEPDAEDTVQSAEWNHLERGRDS
jgi:hypothetical protein